MYYTGDKERIYSRLTREQLSRLIMVDTYEKACAEVDAAKAEYTAAMRDSRPASRELSKSWEMVRKWNTGRLGDYARRRWDAAEDAYSPIRIVLIEAAQYEESATLLMISLYRYEGEESLVVDVISEYDALTVKYNEWRNRCDAKVKYPDLYCLGEAEAWEMHQDHTESYGQDYAEGYKTGANDRAMHKAYHAAREAKDAEEIRKVDEYYFQRAEAQRASEAGKVT